MWICWNAKFVAKKANQLTLERVGYLPHHYSSLISTSFVLRSMNMALNIDEEYGQQYVFVTYDLALAQIAFFIQSKEKPKLYTLFIQLGTFHIERSFFKALGKLIAESGGPYVLTKTRILAPESLLGFLSCKNYHK